MCRSGHGFPEVVAADRLTDGLPQPFRLLRPRTLGQKVRRHTLALAGHPGHRLSRAAHVLACEVNQRNGRTPGRLRVLQQFLRRYPVAAQIAEKQTLRVGITGAWAYTARHHARQASRPRHGGRKRRADTSADDATLSGIDGAVS